jgi:uncharacterized membrane protein YtjA (UPF0391 family)
MSPFLNDNSGAAWAGNARTGHREVIMLYYAVIFFIVAIVAAVFGFTGIATGAAGIAKILFVLFLVGAAIAIVLGLSRRSGQA